jgi:hypothetical protein
MAVENLFNNLLVVGILFAVFTIIYCKVTNKTLRDMIMEIREGFKTDG